MLVKLAASGMCHSDEHLVTGDMALPASAGWQQFPIIGGHEGAGVVVEVGPGVDHARRRATTSSLGFIPSCGRCPSAPPATRTCATSAPPCSSGRQITDGTARHHAQRPGPRPPCACLGTFAEHTRRERGVGCIKIDDGHPARQGRACVGCGVTTGWGSAVYAAEVAAGRHRRRRRHRRHRHERRAGRARWPAPSTSSPSTRWSSSGSRRMELRRHPHRRRRIDEAAAAARRAHLGPDAPTRSIMTMGVGNGDLIGSAMAWSAKGGRCVVTAVPTSTAEPTPQLSLFDLALQEKQLSARSSARPTRATTSPGCSSLYREGQLELDELITNDLPARRDQRGLPGHARRQEHPRRHRLRCPS